MRFRAIVALAAAMITAGFLAAEPAQAAAQYPPTVCASLSVSTTHPLPGESITVSGEGFLPNASVRLELHSASQVLKTVTSDGRGSFSTRVKLPDGVFGEHRIVATSGAPNDQNCPGNPFVIIHIQKHGTAGTSAAPNGNGGGGTSFTGVDVLLILLAAAALIGAGAAVNRTGRRRHAAS